MGETILYTGTRNASSWAMRAWLALREAGVGFIDEEIDIRRPQRFAGLARIGGFSPPAMVPVLRVDGRVVYDSLAIMEYANDCAGGRLLPADPLDRARARAVMAWQHAGLSGICARISFESAFYPDRRALTTTELGEADRLLGHASALLVDSGGPYLFGALSLADLMLVPTALRLGAHACPFERWHGVGDWVAALLTRPAVRDWLTQAGGLSAIWYDDYLPPGAPAALVPGPSPHEWVAALAAAPVAKP